jgi:hypothetical protein
MSSNWVSLWAETSLIRLPGEIELVRAPRRLGFGVTTLAADRPEIRQGPAGVQVTNAV